MLFCRMTVPRTSPLALAIYMASLALPLAQARADDLAATRTSISRARFPTAVAAGGASAVALALASGVVYLAARDCERTHSDDQESSGLNCIPGPGLVAIVSGSLALLSPAIVTSVLMPLYGVQGSAGWSITGSVLGGLLTGSAATVWLSQANAPDVSRALVVTGGAIVVASTTGAMLGFSCSARAKARSKVRGRTLSFSVAPAVDGILLRGLARF